jgi:UDP-glucuronate decarboxylase
MPNSGLGRVFLTGGTGFLGRPLLKRLCARLGTRIGEIVVLTRDPCSFLSRYPESNCAGVVLYAGDMQSFTFPEGKFSHVIHAAGDIGNVRQKTALERYDEVILGCRRTLDFARAAQAERFLYISSGAVYGPQPAGLARIPESYLGAPPTQEAGSSYGEAKRAAEHLCRIYADQFGLQCLVARCFSFVGPGMPAGGHYALGSFLHDAEDPAKSFIKIEGDGTPVRSYLDVEDCADWLMAILDQGTPCYPYNVGSDDAMTIKEVAETVRRVFSPDKPILITRDRADFAGRLRYVPDTQRIQRGLGVRVTRTLEQSLRAIAVGRQAIGRS